MLTAASENTYKQGETAVRHPVLIPLRPGQRLHLLVKPAEFRRLLDSVTEAPATTTSPASLTGSAAPAAARTEPQGETP